MNILLRACHRDPILGPVLFNIFINDIFLFVNNSTIYNYADDNTLSSSDRSPEVVKSNLLQDSEILIKWFSDNKMQANPEKFQAIAIGQRSSDKIKSFQINGIDIPCENEVKLLGVDIDFKLSFNSHVSNICKKASKQLNCLKRVGKYLNRLGKLTIYHTFILSNFNYCPLVWHFCGETNTKKVERIQERALRFIYNDFSNSYEDLLVKSKLPSLQLRRMRTLALESFKIVHGKSPLFLQDLIVLKNNRYNFRYSNTAEVTQARTSRYGLSSFRHMAATVWNSLSNEARNMTSFNQFRSYIETWNGPTCKCSACRAS